jgi:TM2 domain-containing membrane protein YozV
MSDPGASPGLAFLLGFIPGVGAIYNGQYVKGFIHVVIFGVLIAIVNDDQMSGGLQPLFGMMIAVWVFYMAFEAYHTAKRRQLGQPVDEFSSIVPRAGHPARFPLAPTVLIAVGVLFLLHNLNILRIGELLRYWPVALIGLGAYMLYERLSAQVDTNHGAPSAREAANERR